ncbi:MAG: hypothetical protein WCI11_06410 [Candidatus Methylumidiphilus sp.]
MADIDTVSNLKLNFSVRSLSAYAQISFAHSHALARPFAVCPSRVVVCANGAAKVAFFAGRAGNQAGQVN